MASPGLDINLNDPAVKRLLEPEQPKIHKPGENKREMVQLAGDMDHGFQTKYNLDTGKVEVLVAYRGRIGDFDMTIDVYAMPGEPIELHLICPKCKHKSRVTGARKKIEFDPRAKRPYTFVDGSSMPFNGGKLDVETFECGWEMPDAGEHKAGIKAGGITLCRMRMAIDNSIAKDA